MPSHRHHNPGDLYVKFNVKFPEYLDAEAVAKLESAFPPRKPLEKFSKNIMIEEVDLSDLDARQQREATALGEDAMDAEDEHPRVQCANQ